MGSGKETTAKNNDDVSFQEGKFADYISLDVSDEEIGSIDDTRTQQTTLFGSEPSYLHLEDPDEMIKPVLLMKKNLTTESSAAIGNTGYAREESDLKM